MRTRIWIALKLLMAMMVLTGILYPWCVTGVAQAFFSKKANGSLWRKDGKLIGSELIGQTFDSDLYFWSRPSATDYQTMPSSGSNLTITSEKLKRQFAERKKNFQQKNFLAESTDIPSEMLFASGSGLDPHISVKAAVLQVQRISKKRNLSESQKGQLMDLIDKVKENRQLGLFGEPRINVLILNMEMDKLFKTHKYHE